MIPDLGHLSINTIYENNDWFQQLVNSQCSSIGDESLRKQHDTATDLDASMVPDMSLMSIGGRPQRSREEKTRRLQAAQSLYQGARAPADEKKSQNQSLLRAEPARMYRKQSRYSHLTRKKAKHWKR